MKMKRVATIVTLSAALVLVGSVTYAASKKRQGKARIEKAETAEEDAVAAELLAATEEHQKPVAKPRTERVAERVREAGEERQTEL